MNMIVAALILVLSSHAVWAEDAPRAGQPVVLEWADSLVGMGDPASGIREFVGNVRFRQGNVTVTCDRAVQNVAQNVVDLYGKVVVTQEGLQLRAPIARYDGNQRLATASGNIILLEGRRTIRATSGTYSTATRTATFHDSVSAADDTVLVWSDHAVYHRDSRRTLANGNVVVWDTVRSTRLRGDSVIYNPASHESKAWGNAAAWMWEPGKQDTTLMMADTLHQMGDRARRYHASGNVELISGSLAARCQSLVYDDSSGHTRLLSDPVVWADSTQLIADTIDVEAPGRKVHTITGRTNALLASRTDTLRPSRFDQVCGNLVWLDVKQDTIRQLTAIGDAQSITFSAEEEQADGLARMKSDTIKAYFVDGKPDDIYWLGGIAGEHHPEPLVQGRELSYRVPGFEWRVDRPVYSPLPSRTSQPPTRTLPRVKAGEGALDVKKQ